MKDFSSPIEVFCTVSTQIFRDNKRIQLFEVSASEDDFVSSIRWEIVVAETKDEKGFAPA